MLALFGLVDFTDAPIILRGQALGLGFVAIILAYALYNLSYAALSYPAGKLSDRVPRRTVYTVGLGLFAIAYLGLGPADTGGWVWVLLPMYGGYTALTDGVEKAWVADHLPPDRLGSGLGYFQGVTGDCALIAGLWAGCCGRRRTQPAADLRRGHRRTVLCPHRPRVRRPHHPRATSPFWMRLRSIGDPCRLCSRTVRDGFAGLTVGCSVGRRDGSSSRRQG